MPVSFESIHVAALLDSGSSINIISETLYNSLPYCCKYPIDTDNRDSVKLANNQTVEIQGTAYIVLKTQDEKHRILLYVLKQSSNSLILGTRYLIKNQITINFGS